ncbi:MAG TPA: hypothetical protein VK809_04750 [Bacteroidia bacterium]|nr:hypothetical protein [Bacteroidia bacterium]
MNQAKNYLFILAFVGLAWGSCDKKPVSPPSTTTTVTNNTTATTPTPAIGFDSWADITDPNSFRIIDSSNIISVWGSVNYGPSGAYGFIIKFYAKSQGIYLLSNKNNGSYSEGGWSPSHGFWSINYYTDSIYIGKVTLTELDTINHVASGTFYFNCEEQYLTINGGLDSVTNGYFTNLKW